LKVQLTGAGGVQEAEAIVDMDEATVLPEGQRDLLLFLAREPELAEAGAIAEHFAVGIEITENAGRLEHGEHRPAHKEQLRQRIVVARPDRGIILGAETVAQADADEAAM